MKTIVSLGGIAQGVVIDRRVDKSQRARIRDNAPHAHYALERDDIRAELSAFKDICEIIAPYGVKSVWEPFGGSGWHSALIQSIVYPNNHYVNDISVDCVDSIKATSARIAAEADDSMKALAENKRRGFSWVHADFNLLTLERMATHPQLRRAFLGVFEAADDFVTFTDTTPYELETEAARYAWYAELRRWVRALTGRSITTTVQWGPAAMHLVLPPTSWPDVHTIKPASSPLEVVVISETAT